MVKLCVGKLNFFLLHTTRPTLPAVTVFTIKNKTPANQKKVPKLLACNTDL